MLARPECLLFKYTTTKIFIGVFVINHPPAKTNTPNGPFWHAQIACYRHHNGNSGAPSLCQWVCVRNTHPVRFLWNKSELWHGYEMASGAPRHADINLSPTPAEP